MKSIDVIIPSYRLQSEYLIPIVQMEIPSDTEVRYLIIADNPKSTIPINLANIIDNKNIFLFRNKDNYGAHKSRNVGLNNSTADWVLFLDDDIKPSKNLLQKYLDIAEKQPGEIGFFGETLFPNPINIFTKGIIACDILTFFFIAGYYKELKWAPTSNVFIKRSAIGDIRFKDIFPRNGGGEDIDFFLQIFQQSGQELQCVKNTCVYHDWWNNGQRNYTRFIRWSFGDSLLHKIFPAYTYYNFPNVIESLVFGIIFGLVLFISSASIIPLLCILIGISFGETFVEFIRTLIYKGLKQSKYVFEGVLIRASNDIGRLYMQLVKLKRVRGICERFDHFCDKKHILYQRIWGAIKFISYLIFSIGFFYLT